MRAMLTKLQSSYMINIIIHVLTIPVFNNIHNFHLGCPLRWDESLGEKVTFFTATYHVIETWTVHMNFLKY